MQKNITGFALWHGWPSITRLSQLPAPGVLRYALKKITRSLEPHWKDIIDFIQNDMAEHGWAPQPSGLPTLGDAFYQRLEGMLAHDISVDIHEFDEDLLQGVDGLSANDELRITFLFRSIPVEPVVSPANAE